MKAFSLSKYIKLKNITKYYIKGGGGSGKRLVSLNSYSYTAPPSPPPPGVFLIS